MSMGENHGSEFTSTEKSEWKQLEIDIGCISASSYSYISDLEQQVCLSYSILKFQVSKAFIIPNCRTNYVILYMGLRVRLVYMYAYSVGIFNWIWNCHHHCQIMILSNPAETHEPMQYTLHSLHTTDQKQKRNILLVSIGGVLQPYMISEWEIIIVASGWLFIATKKSGCL